MSFLGGNLLRFHPTWPKASPTRWMSLKESSSVPDGLAAPTTALQTDGTDCSITIRTLWLLQTFLTELGAVFLVIVQLEDKSALSWSPTSWTGFFTVDADTGVCSPLYREQLPAEALWGLVVLNHTLSDNCHLTQLCIQPPCLFSDHVRVSMCSSHKGVVDSILIDFKHSILTTTIDWQVSGERYFCLSFFLYFYLFIFFTVFSATKYQKGYPISN